MKIKINDLKLKGIKFRVNQKSSIFYSDKGILKFAVIIGIVDSLLKTNTLIRSAAPFGSIFIISISILYDTLGTKTGK